MKKITRWIFPPDTLRKISGGQSGSSFDSDYKEKLQQKDILYLIQVHDLDIP